MLSMKRAQLSIFINLLLLLALGSCVAVQNRTQQYAEVLVVGSIHGMHRDHPTYSYVALYDAVRAFKPDAVGVEIRAEDLTRDGAYLKANYPQEMIALAAEYWPRVFGFDWLGPELEGRPVPANYWRDESWLKKLEKERSDDGTYQSAEISRLQKEQLEIARGATPASMNDGRYDAVTLRYYEALEALLRGSRYQRLADFYQARNEAIGRNIEKFVRRNRGRRIAIVTGADHRVYVVRHLQRTLGPSVKLAQIRGSYSR
jgi:hypothetical protein